MYNTFIIYLNKIAIISVLFILLPVVLGSIYSNDTLSSYLISVLCFFFLTIISAKLILGEQNYIRFYSIVYIVEIILGLIHYIYFVDPHYFATEGGPNGKFWHEYLSVFNSLERLNGLRDSVSVFYWMSQREFQVTHAEIWHLISWPFFFLGNKWLNYSALNAFSCLLTSMNILYLYHNSYFYENSIEKQVRYWTAFFPIFLLNDTVWRDSFGIALISIAIVLTSLSKNIIEWIVSFFVFGIFSFLQRTVYFFLAGISSMWNYIGEIKNMSAKILLFVVGFIALYLLIITSDVNNEGYSSGYINSMSLFALPIKIVFGMIGPFPWTLFPTLVERNPVFAWQLQDYLMGTFQFGYLLCIIFNWKTVSFRNLDVMTIMGFGMMLSGFLTRQLHIVYIAEGVIFTLPWFFSQFSTVYCRYFYYSLIILFALNILLLITGNIGIASMWH